MSGTDKELKSGHRQSVENAQLNITGHKLTFLYLFIYYVYMYYYCITLFTPYKNNPQNSWKPKSAVPGSKTAGFGFRLYGVLLKDSIILCNAIFCDWKSALSVYLNQQS